ncbi:MAG TPA: hypothetical protein VL738_13310 [Dactylosporangium sp.]|jgi:hypothetical protein|nr:hypothetical protein [Dactylosporangium sp.]
MNDDDVTRDGLPRFIYGEYTGEMPLPARPEPEEDDEAPAKMDRQTMILLGSGGLALLLIIGLVIAALSTGGADDTPAAANQESANPSASVAPPASTDSPEPTKSWPLATDIGHQAEPTTGKPTNTAKPGNPTTRPGPPKPTLTVKPRPSRG